MDDIFVYIVDLPVGVAEMVAPCFGGFTIYLNARLSDQGREKAYLHAIEHVERDDWKHNDVQTIESEVNHGNS